MLVLLAAAASLTEVCRTAPPAAAASPDPEEAARYVEVGDAARTDGDQVIAVVAYRQAIAQEAGNARATTALRELCNVATAGTASTTLADAIERYRRGDRAGARSLVETLVAPDGTLPAGGHFLLGVLALEEHDRATAERELGLAQREAAYHDLTLDMLRLARRDGRIALTAITASEVDSNPQQLPDTPPMNASTGPREGDLGLIVAGALTVRPHRAVTLRNLLSWRKQRVLDELDYLGENVQASVELGRRATRGSLQYDFDYDVVGGTGYLLAHRGLAELRHDLGRSELHASGSVRRRDYQQATVEPFTGWVFGGDVGMTVHVSSRIDLDPRVVAWREDTADATFALRAAGSALAVRTRPASRLRVSVQAAAWFAAYDAAETDGGQRRDMHLEATTDVEIDLSDHVLALVGAAATRNSSTIEDFRYWKLVGRLGLAFAIGGP